MRRDSVQPVEGEGTSKRARHRRRERVRARVDARKSMPGCPEQGKPGYDLTDEAEAALARRRGGPGLVLVKCVCGYWHHRQA